MERSRSGDEFPVRYGKYELLSRIGHGGMSEVFLAKFRGFSGFEKTVVIKRLFSHLAEKASVVDMFTHEAKLGAEAQHRNLVEVFELGQAENGELYMAMEYVAGTDLRQLLRAAAVNALRVPPWFSAYVVSELLAGLAFIHALTDSFGKKRNIVHRDVTPGNVFVSFLGDIKLGDFGVVQDDMRARYTRPGELKGKVPYMSPEQLRGERLDHRADVFAAGVILWECLTQRRLFGGRPDVEAMNLICYGERKPPSHLSSDVPPELDACVLQALEHDKERRIPSALEFQARLLDLLPTMQGRAFAPDVCKVVDGLVQSRDRSQLAGLRSISEASIIRQNFFDQTPVSGSSSRSAVAPANPDAVEELRQPRLAVKAIEAKESELEAELSSVSVPANRSEAHMSEVHARAPRRRPSTLVIAALLLVLAVVGVGGFAVSSGDNMRLVKRKLRDGLIGRAPGGVLIVESVPPNARIVLDDEDTGRRTPLEIENVESRVVHDLKLELVGLRTVTTTVEIRSGERRTMTILFPDAMVPLSVTSEPAGAELWIDDTSVALTPASMSLRVAVPAKIRVTKAGFVAFAQTVTPEPNRPVSLEVALEKTPELKAAEEAEKAAEVAEAAARADAEHRRTKKKRRR